MRLACRLIQKCLLLAAAVVLPLAAKAQTVQLLTVDQSTWSYQSNKVDPAYITPDAWTVPAFDDSEWPTGKGLFGLEPGIATGLPGDRRPGRRADLAASTLADGTSPHLQSQAPR